MIISALSCTLLTHDQVLFVIFLWLPMTILQTNTSWITFCTTS